MAFQLTEDWKRPGGNIGWLETVAVELIAYVINAWDISNVRVVIHSDNQGTIELPYKPCDLLHLLHFYPPFHHPFLLLHPF